ncbi:MAG: poly-gamma-glutamate biosynthesis protein [Acidimicrobiaceae bacterium]|nr:poly-gamma-glutamate biosynthesis protein [Acidimicrobiaceae bacterium]
MSDPTGIDPEHDVMSETERRVAWHLTRMLMAFFTVALVMIWADLSIDLTTLTGVSRDESGPAPATTTAPPQTPADGGSETSLPQGSPTTTTLPFEARTFTMVATGDLLVHEYVADMAGFYGSDSAYDFNPMFRRVQPVLAGADLAICHLETPLSEDNSDLVYYPNFRVPFELADAIGAAGYDGCSVASNHSLDAGASGVRATLSHLDRAGVAHSGMALDQAGAGPAWFAPGSISVAHLSYTDIMNGASLPTDPPWLVASLDPVKVVTDAEVAVAEGAEFVVVSIHWGIEYQSEPTDRQAEVSAQLLASPVIDLLIGHQAHVIQPVLQFSDKYAAIGLGNFLSNQPGDERRNCRPECPDSTQDGVVAWFAVADRPDGSVAVVDAGYVPTWVDRSTYEIVPLGIDNPPGADPAVLAESEGRTASVLEPPLRRITFD